MGFMVKAVVMVVIASLAIKVHDCKAYSTCNVTVKEEPQGRVQLIELMLPRHTRSGDAKKTVSGDEPRYEIVIKSNRNVRDPKGTPKIKIFVESDDYSSEKTSSKQRNGTSTGSRGGNKDYQPVPLAIQSSVSNVDRHNDKDHSLNHGSYTSSSGKGQVSSYSNNTRVVDEIERKNSHRTDKPIRERDIQTVKDAGSYAIPHGNASIYRNDDREQKNKRKKEGENPSLLSTKPTEAYPVDDSRKRLVPENTARTQETEVYKATIQRPLLSENSARISETESQHHPHHHHHHGPSFESLPAPYHKDDTTPSVGKELVYEPETGILVADTNYNAKRFAEHPRTPTQDTRGYGERESSRPRTEDEVYEERRRSSQRRVEADDVGRRPIREEPIPDRNTYRDNGYSSARSHSANEYTRGGSTQYGDTSDGERRRSDASYSSEGKKSFGSDLYDVPGDSRVVTNTEPPYQIESHNERATRYETTTRHSTTQHKDYYGFPESYTSTMYEASRPSSYEGPSSLPGSSCPSVFKYTEYGDNRWYADIYVTTDETLSGMRLDVDLSKKADILTAVAAEVKSTDNIRFTILSLTKNLTPGNPEVVQIMVKYNVNERAPFVKSISLNGRQICPSATRTTKGPNLVYPIDVIEQKRTTERVPEVYTRPPAVNEYTRTTIRRNTYKTTTPPTDFLPVPNPDAYESPVYSTSNRPTTKRPSSNHQTFTNRPASPVLSNSDNRRPGEAISGGNNNYNNFGGGTVPNNPTNNRRPTDGGKNIPCGTPAIQPRPLITNGQNTARGQWPWHAALYKNVGPNLSYSCGGSLVTNLHVITAAHCVTMEYSSTPLDPKMLLVYLGKYHLYIWTENGIATKEVARVTVHPNYNVTDFRSDIAVLTLSSKTEFTDFIRPVCLWDERNTRIEDIVGRQGTVVGWGYDDTKQLTEELKQAKMPVVKQNECLWSYPDFYPKFTSNTTYCAGFKNGTSVCNGDSGGGMVFPVKVNDEERWFLRGLVSLSPGLKDIRICDTFQYVVFTDVAKYRPWLEDVIS